MPAEQKAARRTVGTSGHRASEMNSALRQARSEAVGTVPTYRHKGPDPEPPKAGQADLVKLAISMMMSPAYLNIVVQEEQRSRL